MGSRSGTQLPPLKPPTKQSPYPHSGALKGLSMQWWGGVGVCVCAEMRVTTDLSDGLGIILIEIMSWWTFVSAVLKHSSKKSLQIQNDVKWVAES